MRSSPGLTTGLDALVAAESVFYSGVIDLIAASNVPPGRIRSNAHLGVAQFRSAEGRLNRRPYAGTGVFDSIEALGARRARRLFNAEHANVQPLSGTAANLAAFKAVLDPGDTLLAMDLHAGGHLSHGSDVHLSGLLFRVARYGVDPVSHRLNYEEIARQAKVSRPKAIICGASAYPRTIDYGRMATIAQEVGATLLADIAHVAGLIAVGLHPNPCEHDAIVSSSVEKTLRGDRGGFLLTPREHADKIDRGVFPGTQSSVDLESLVQKAELFRFASTKRFSAYQRMVVANAEALAAELLGAGITLTTGGTDTHLLVVDLRGGALTGRLAEERLASIGILSNRNLLPFDPLPPTEASGLRLGTAAVTARGFSAADMRAIGGIVVETLATKSWSASQARRLRGRVRSLVAVVRENDELADF